MAFPPNAWVPVQSVLLVALVGLGVGARGQWPGEASFMAGGVLFVIAAWIGIAGVRSLGDNRTARPEPKAGSQLIQHGIYRRIRHPLYASVMLGGLGWALLWQSAPALVVAAALTAFLDAKARREERLLREIFPEYAAYAARSWRFVPWIH